MFHRGSRIYKYVIRLIGVFWGARLSFFFPSRTRIVDRREVSMAPLLKALRISELAPTIPTGLAALVVAELFYKFHSFTLECLAFLATWYALDLVARPLAAAARIAAPRLLGGPDGTGSRP
jgi:hypothetical protein